MIVLETTRAVMEAPAYVGIDRAALRRWAAHLGAGDLRPGGYELLGELPGDREQLANLILLVDAVNFCFWGPRPTCAYRGRTWAGFEAMLVLILEAGRRDPRWFDARFWCGMSTSEFREALGAGGGLAMMDQREQIVRQTGVLLVERFEGRFAAAVESVNGRAWDLAVLLLVSFDSFRDVGVCRGRPVFFAKRAQIAALDLSIAWELHGYAPLEGLERLTAFADYRVPQALRHLGILRLEPGLAEAIDRGQEIAAGSEAEIEIRAATVCAVEEARLALAERGVDVPGWQIDGWLWRRARAPDVTVPHHRTRTIFY